MRPAAAAAIVKRLLILSALELVGLPLARTGTTPAVVIASICFSSRESIAHNERSDAGWSLAQDKIRTHFIVNAQDPVNCGDRTA